MAGSFRKEGNLILKHGTFLRPGMGAILVAVVAAAIAAVACGGGNTTTTNASSAVTATVSTAAETAAKNAAAISAVNILDNAGLHQFDVTLAAGTVPPTAQVTAERMQTVLLLTDWPSAALKGDAQQLATKLAAMATALNTDSPNLKVAGAAAHDAHDTEHLFSTAVWNYLEGQAGVRKAPSDVTPTTR